LDELVDDAEAIAYLTPTGDEPVVVKQSLIHTLAFPSQEFKLKVDANVEGALGEGRVGTIEWVAASPGTLGLRRSRRNDAPPPTAVIAGGPVPDAAQREAIVRVVDAAIADS